MRRSIGCIEGKRLVEYHRAHERRHTLATSTGHAASVGGSAVQMQDLRPTYVNAQKTPLYNSHHRIDGLPKKARRKATSSMKDRFIPSVQTTFCRNRKHSFDVILEITKQVSCIAQNE